MKFELNTLYNMDCMDALKDIPNKFFQLGIIDPPYGIGEDGHKNKSRGCIAKSTDFKPYIGNDALPPPESYFHELMRVTKNQIIWGANHFISRIPYDSPCWIVWDKQNGATDFADCELAWTSFKTATRKFTFTWSGMRQGDMKHKEKRVHPNQKPVRLYEWLLTKYAKPEDGPILDTHFGSANCLIACHNLGFDFLGFELDEYYYNVGKERLEDVRSQVRFNL